MTYPMIRPRAVHTRAGFTLIEAVMSMLIVGLMLIAALNTVGAAKTAQYRNSENSLGPMLAEELMTEVLAKAYEEPVDAVLFGRESESATVRTSWDDVDDYNGWSAKPPQNADGSPVAGAEEWERSVTITWVNTATLAPDVSGHKRIEVTVTHGSKDIVTLTSLRTAAWPD